MASIEELNEQLDQLKEKVRSTILENQARYENEMATASELSDMVLVETLHERGFLVHHILP